MSGTRNDFSKTIGTCDSDFIEGFTLQLAKASSGDETSANFMLSATRGLVPINPAETMLCGQMTAVHMAVMKCAENLANAQTMQQFTACESALNKSARTYVAQFEALNRGRSSNEHKPTVQNVAVSGSAQAIVGNVTQNTEVTPECKSESSEVPTNTQGERAHMPTTIQTSGKVAASSSPKRERPK